MCTLSSQVEESGDWRRTYVCMYILNCVSHVRYVHVRTVTTSAEYGWRVFALVSCIVGLNRSPSESLQPPQGHTVLGPLVLCRCLPRQLLAARARLCWCCSWAIKGGHTCPTSVHAHYLTSSTFTSLPAILMYVLSYL